MKFINVPTFLISLAIGLFIAYISVPSPTVIMVYPTPDNIDKVQYSDKAGTCFSFTSNKVECPANKDHLKQIPVQN